MDPLRSAVSDALTYPDDHPVGMAVPEGGSNCAKCEYLRGGAICTNEKFVAWRKRHAERHKSFRPSFISDPSRYCCDFFEARTVGLALATRDAVAQYLEDTAERLILDFHDVVAETIQRRFVLEPAAEAGRVENAGAVGLDKKLLKVFPFGGDTVKLFTVNGQHIRTPIENGGLGCLNFTMGMNGYAANDPMYPGAPAWCAEDEICLHNLLSPVDFMAVLVHELFERWAMKVHHLSYGDAHEQVANLSEQCARRVLATPRWAEAF